MLKGCRFTYQLTIKQNTMATIKLVQAINNYINDAKYEFEQGQIKEGNHFLNVVKQLLIDNKDTNTEVTFEYLNNISLMVSNWK